MKKITIFLLLLLFSTLNCKDSYQQDNKAYTVDMYIDDLINNTYHSDYLPEFSPENITELLEYRNNTKTLLLFPSNPISSYWQISCKLGFYVLWTIESIRLSYGLKDLSQMDRFPSQNPIVEYWDTTKMTYVMDESDSCLEKIADAYSTWWSKDKNQNFSRLRQIDPLENSGYKWH